jgi:CDP-diacylglycerol--glycerol-3-phosphate 3-phosphatidyltransferase
MAGRAVTASPLHRLVYEDGELKLANLVTLSRGLAIAPILGFLAAGRPAVALVLYVAAASTDLVDGWLARRSGRASSYGAQLDAVVDNLFSLAILAFLLLAYPGVGERHLLSLVLLFGAPVAYLAVSWLLARRLLMFHFWSAKAGAFLLFCLWPLVEVSGWEGWIEIAAGVVFLSRAEQIVFILRGGTDLEAPHALAPVTAPDARG